MLAPDQVRLWYGWAELSPADPIVAGSLGRWRVIYHVGRHGVAAGGSLKLLWRAASDWPPLQGRDPYEESFCTVATTGRARLAWRYDPRGHAQPWPRALVVDVAQWGLAEGDEVTIDLGDPEGGSPGVRAQTFVERNHEFRVVVDAMGRGQHVAIPSPTVEIVAGPPERLAVVAPSQVAVGEPFALTLRLEDRWGNVARGYTGRVALQGLDGLAAVELARGDGGVRRIGGLRLNAPGLYRVRGREAVLGLEGESNPLRVMPAGEQAPALLWGDLAGESEETGGTGTAAEYFSFARDAAALDFCALQAGACHVSPSFWSQLQEAVSANDEPGRFAAFLGYHWAGNTCGGGTRHVLFAGDAGEFYSASPESGDNCRFPLANLYEALRRHDALLIVGAASPAANLDCYDEGLEPLVEVCSGWGEFPWLVEEALRRGRRVGLTASSGELQGRPGASWPGAGDRVARGGLTCVLAPERTRQAIWEALRARHCYATSGPRILLDVQADGHTMGEVYQAAAPPELRLHVAGTAEIEALEIRRGAEVAYRCPE
ncbi:MAG TPA: DUF3604 domain-containing protein, partial [Anaerolineae bacterium]|nr:DUF3604 domain-containing protein [Anaerolineae bacterium]